MQSRLALILGLFGFFTQGCGPSDSAVSNPSAYVSPETAQLAFAKIENIDYLPFGYKVDGCYARSLFMSMELAADVIPSSAQFAVGDLRPSSEVSWRYHVVPMLVVGSDSEPTVIDPSLIARPVKRSQWLDVMNTQGFTELVAVPGSYYDPYSTPEKSQEKIIHSFAELPPFDLEHITRACRTLNQYLSLENAANFREKQAKLSSKANSLTLKLIEKGKLSSEGERVRHVDQSINIDCEGSPFD